MADRDDGRDARDASLPPGVTAARADRAAAVLDERMLRFCLDWEIRKGLLLRHKTAVLAITLPGSDADHDDGAPPGSTEHLDELAHFARSAFWDTDLVGRLDGEGLAILLPQTEVLHAAAAAQRFLKTVRERSGARLAPGVGVACHPEAASSADDLLSVAREAARVAEARGGDRIEIVTGDQRAASRAPRPTILIVDDEPRNVRLLEAMISRLDVTTYVADGGARALELLKNHDVDLVLLDVMMPEIDGLEVCRRIKSAASTRMIPVILVTAYDDDESRMLGVEAGADDFIAKPPRTADVLARAQRLLGVKKLTDRLADIESVLLSLAQAIEAKHEYTEGHSRRVASLAVAIGIRLGLGDVDYESLRFGGLLHDIGKLGVPERVLDKEGPLNDEEWAAIRTHPERGYVICLPLQKTLGTALDAIRQHHERLDGSGYPRGLSGEAVAIHGRILAVADVYDALTTNRAYRKAFSPPDAHEMLRREAAAGKLSGEVVEALVQITKEYHPA